MISTLSLLALTLHAPLAKGPVSPTLDQNIVARCEVPVQPGIVPQPFTFTISDKQFSLFVADHDFFIGIETLSDLSLATDEIGVEVPEEMPCENDSVRFSYYLSLNKVRVDLYEIQDGVKVKVSSELYDLKNTVQININ